MTVQAFDAKNKLDYDRNTELLAQGLMQIASDPNLKPTMAELSRITGIHRNTIRQRDFPAQRLEAIKDNQSAYLMAVGGAAYLVAKAIKAAKVVGFADLGMEAIYEFDLQDMPVTVAVDAQGSSVHTTGPIEWCTKIGKLPADKLFGNKH